MAVTNEARFGTPRWSAGSDSFPGRVGTDAYLDQVTTQAAISLKGLAGARPAAAIRDRYYWATDTSRLYYDDGAAWTEVSPIGGGGVPVGQVLSSGGAAGAEGVSRIAARADHKHPEPAWPVRINQWNRGDVSGANFPSDTFVSGSLAALIGGTISAAPAGIYQVGFTLVLSTASAATDAFTTGRVRFTVHGTGPIGTSEANLINSAGAFDMRADLDRKAIAYSWSGKSLINVSDTITFKVYAQADNANGQVWSVGSNMFATYLGPA